MAVTSVELFLILRFDPAPKTKFFLTSGDDWHRWTWQLQNTLTTKNEFAQIFDLSSDEKRGFEGSGNLFKVAATPYYASLASSSLPIRRILMPTGAELTTGAQQMLDPLGENHHSPTPRVVHRYSDRVLFLVTDTCSVYCRFCTRKRFTGQEQGFADSGEYAEALQYIRSHRGIREVILSGGDPLTLSNKVLQRTLDDIRSIPHVEIIRIGTRMLTVCPMRVDQDLVAILKAHNPVYMMTHFSHPAELTFEAKEALTVLADNGVPLFNQMVLLNGVNNSAPIVQALSRRLLYLRVKPYYMFQCDPSEGSDHLRTTVENSEEIVRELWGHLSGLALPTLSLDIPGGGGKASLVPDFMISQSEGVREYLGWDKVKGTYRNPSLPMEVPADSHLYEREWEETKRAKRAKRAEKLDSFESRKFHDKLLE